MYKLTQTINGADRSEHQAEVSDEARIKELEAAVKRLEIQLKLEKRKKNVKNESSAPTKKHYDIKTVREGMILSEIFGPAVSKRRSRIWG